MKNKFIKSELWYLSLSGAFQRNNVYAEDIDDANGKKKETFKLKLKKSVIEIAKNYINPIDDPEHIANIGDLVTTNQDVILKGGKLKFGTAQKLLNLYLKYLWCTDKLLQVPPHCPVDSIILKKSNSFKNAKWTQLDCPDTYMLYINELRMIAKSQMTSLAEWELEVFNRRAEQTLI